MISARRTFREIIEYVFNFNNMDKFLRDSIILAYAAGIIFIIIYHSLLGIIAGLLWFILGELSAIRRELIRK